MTTTTLTADQGLSANLPASARTRIEVLDALRGFAILGIFLINIPLMAPAGDMGLRVGDVPWYDALAQTVTDLFFEGTQRGLLEMLFGAGMMILTAKALTADGPIGIADTYLRRNMWLVLFGLLHIFVVRWGYDILHVYGLAALFLFTFRTLPAAAALAAGLVIAGSLQYAAAAGYAPGAPNGSGAAEIKGAVQIWYETVKGLGLWMTVAEAFGTMLIGVALFKWGIIQGRKSERFYLMMMILGYGLGAALRLMPLSGQTSLSGGPSPSEFGRIIMTLGHVGMMNCLWKTRVGVRLLSPLLAAGRTAFSLYVMQSLIGIWVLWAPWGPLTQLNLGSAGVMGVVICVVALQVILANLWLRKFDMGPLEMLWRRLVKLAS
ncbi:MAG: DUF418 domain-containing protein [Asticcacaulis sp.]|uniref:DUF418 domain-containing protein n=1 Tax=Asticcacaulis sp. TaxID=1872648 RepID=UPI0025C6E844|nr:DUF418 domain-containing protein [Asticcacaulis sp.]MCA1936521.1 DUF418 domain-containing protein [Asticcacaulis sp.]